MYIVYEDLKTGFWFTFHWNKKYTLFIDKTFSKAYCTWLSYIWILVPGTFVQSNIPNDVPWWQVLGLVQFSFTTPDLKITDTSRKVSVCQNSCPGKIWNKQQNQWVVNIELHKAMTFEKRSWVHKAEQFIYILNLWINLKSHCSTYRVCNYIKSSTGLRLAWISDRPGTPPIYMGSLVLISEDPTAPVPAGALFPSTVNKSTFLALFTANQINM